MTLLRLARRHTRRMPVSFFFFRRLGARHVPVVSLRRRARRVHHEVFDLRVEHGGRAGERRERARQERRRGGGGVGLGSEARAFNRGDERLGDQPPRRRTRAEVAERRRERVGVGVTRPRLAAAEPRRDFRVKLSQTRGGFRARFRLRARLRVAPRGEMDRFVFRVGFRVGREQASRRRLTQRGEALVEGAGGLVVPGRGVDPRRARVHAARQQHVSLRLPVPGLLVVDVGRHAHAARLASKRFRQNLEVLAQRLARLLELGDAQRERLGELARPRQRRLRLALGISRRAALVQQRHARGDVERAQGVAKRASSLGGEPVRLFFFFFFFFFFRVARRERFAILFVRLDFVPVILLLLAHERLAVRLGERRERRQDVRETLLVAREICAPNQLRDRRERRLRGRHGAHQMRLRQQPEPRAPLRRAIDRTLHVSNRRRKRLRGERRVRARTASLGFLGFLFPPLLRFAKVKVREGALGRLRAYRARQKAAQRLAELGEVHPVQQRHNLRRREDVTRRTRFDRRRENNRARVFGDVLGRVRRRDVARETVQSIRGDYLSQLLRQRGVLLDAAVQPLQVVGSEATRRVRVLRAKRAPPRPRRRRPHLLLREQFARSGRLRLGGESRGLRPRRLLGGGRVETRALRGDRALRSRHLRRLLLLRRRRRRRRRRRLRHRRVGIALARRRRGAARIAFAPGAPGAPGAAAAAAASTATALARRAGRTLASRRHANADLMMSPATRLLFRSKRKLTDRSEPVQLSLRARVDLT